MPIKKAIACLSFVVTAFVYASASGAAHCPPLQSTDRVQGIGEMLKSCIREAKKGDAAASWTLAVMSRYMVCDETAESQRIANLWQDVAESSSNPNAIFESAMLELYALGNSIEEEEIQSIKDIVGKLNVAAQLGQRDANFQLYRLHNTFRYANPRITELGSYVDAVGHLLRAVDLGSYMAAEELAAAYLSAKDAQNPASNGPEGVWREPSYGPLIDELGRRGMLPKNMAKGA